jgi:hypothetical protein
MLGRTLITLAALAAAFGGCTTVPADPATAAAPALPADIAERVDRMRGCWIAREGSGATFLRLLPPIIGAPTIGGGVDRTGTTTVDRTAILSFARDGATASLTLKGQAPVSYVADTPAWGPKGANWLVYRSTSEPVRFMVIEAPGETLRIMTASAPAPGRGAAMSPLYEANRDGCD